MSVCSISYEMREDEKTCDRSMKELTAAKKPKRTRWIERKVDGIMEHTHARTATETGPGARRSARRGGAAAPLVAAVRVVVPVVVVVLLLLLRDLVVRVAG